MSRKRKAPDAWRKEQQDPILFHKLEWLGDILFFASIVVAIGFYLKPSWPWLLACLGLLITVFSLALFLPAYFTLMTVSKENNDGPQHGISLSGVLCFASVPLMTQQYYQVRHEWQLVLAALVLVVLVMTILLRFSMDKMGGGTVLLVILFVGICGYCGLNHINALLDFSEPAHYQRDMIGYRTLSGRHRRLQYFCIVEGNHGEETFVEVPEELYLQLLDADTVCLDIHPGALGIEYVDIHLLED